MTQPLVHAIRHIAFEDLGSFEQPSRAGVGRSDVSQGPKGGEIEGGLGTARSLREKA